MTYFSSTQNTLLDYLVELFWLFRGNYLNHKARVYLRTFLNLDILVAVVYRVIVRKVVYESRLVRDFYY